MTSLQISIDEDDFQAFVDGQLPPERRRAVMAYLASRPDEASRMDDYRTLSEALHLGFDEVLYEPLPKRLRVEHYRGQSSWAGRLGDWIGLARLGPVLRFASVALPLLAAGAGVGWGVAEHWPASEVESPGQDFARQAYNAHVVFAPDLRHPVEFGADQQDSLLLWLSERLGAALHAPNLQDIGYTLVGGRLVPASGQPAALLMYENSDAHRITIYIRAGWAPPSNGAPEGFIAFASDDGAGTGVYWAEGKLAYALIGPMDREQLFSAAKIIQQQLQVPTLPALTPEQTATTEKDAT
jgi:anti-sigma factor RsiW